MEVKEYGLYNNVKGEFQFDIKEKSQTKAMVEGLAMGIMAKSLFDRKKINIVANLVKCFLRRKASLGA